MIEAFKSWYHRYLSHAEAGNLLFVILFFLILVAGFGHILAPIFVSVVLAYLLDWAVSFLERCRLPHTAAVIIVFLLFVSIVLLLLLVLLPLLAKQLASVAQELPQTIARIQTGLNQLRDKIPYLSDATVQNLLASAKDKLTAFAQKFVSASVSAIPGAIALVVYLIMIPLLIYFFLMDRDQILKWCSRFAPRKRSALNKVWVELNKQIGNYVRGKSLEAIIVGVASYIGFLAVGLEYAALVAVGVGLAVWIPYVGAVLSTIPVIVIGLLQWGLTGHFWVMLIIYSIIIGLDGTVLTALLFSNTNALHPSVVIIATLVFGAIWGFWGVFFAIPLASLLKALITHWPVTEDR